MPPRTPASPGTARRVSPRAAPRPRARVGPLAGAGGGEEGLGPAAATIGAASGVAPPMTADDRPMRAGDLPTRAGDMPMNPGDAPTMAGWSAWRGAPLRPMVAAAVLGTACVAWAAYPVRSAGRLGLAIAVLAACRVAAGAAPLAASRLVAPGRSRGLKG